MPPFQYEAPPAPLVGTIADLIARQGQVRALAAQQIAQTNAQAALSRGHAWGQAAHDLSQLPMQAVAQTRANKVAESEMQLRGLQTEQAQMQVSAMRRQQQAEQDLVAAIQGNTVDGVTDHQKVASIIGQKYPGADAKYLEGVAGMEETQNKLIAQRKSLNDMWTTQIGLLAKNAPDQGVLMQQVGTLAAQGLIPKGVADKVLQDVQGATDYAALQKRYVAAADAVAKPIDVKEGETRYGGVSLTPMVTGATKPPTDKWALAYQMTDPNLSPQDRAAAAMKTIEAQADKEGTSATHKVNIVGQPGELYADYIPGKGGATGKWMYGGQDVTGKVRGIPSAAVQIHNEQKATYGPEVVQYWAKQLKNDFGILPAIKALPKDVQGEVMAQFAKNGGNAVKLSEATRSMAEMANVLLPKKDEIITLAEKLDKAGLMGPLGGRWRDLTAQKLGGEDLFNIAHGDKQLIADIGKFQVLVGMYKTAVARAHGGARGGGSPMMLTHINDMFNATTADLSLFKGEMQGFHSFMDDYAQMLPGAYEDTMAKQGQPSGGAAATPTGLPAPGAQFQGGTVVGIREKK